MAQWLRTLTTLADGPEFNSEQQHGGSQPYIMGFDALFWHTDVHANKALLR